MVCFKSNCALLVFVLFLKIAITEGSFIEDAGENRGSFRRLKSTNVSQGPAYNGSSTYGKTQNETEKCKLVVINETRVRESLKGLLDAGGKLIEIHLSFVNVSVDPAAKTDREMYNPAFWVRTTGKFGRSILLLRHTYGIISLGTLSYDVFGLSVSLTEQPYGCMKSLDAKYSERLIKSLLLNDFSTEKGQHTLGENGRICNLHLKSDNGKSAFIYECCDVSGECEELQPDFWTMALTVVIRVIQILAFLYSPLLVPATWYRSKNSESEYILNLAKPKDMNLKEKIFKDDSVKYMIDKTCEKCVKLNKVRFKIQIFKLVPENKVPVGILSSLHYNLIRCKVRRFAGATGCCDSSICGECLQKRIHIRWYVFFQSVMKGVMALIVTVPVIIWLLEYFLYEKEEFSSRQRAADSRGLFTDYEGSITSLPPDHIFFLSCYWIICATLLVMFVLKCGMRLLGDKRHKMTLFIIRNAFREMKDSQERRSNVYIGSLISILWPFKKLGIYAFFCVFLYWLICIPCVIVILSIYCFPAVNVSFEIMKQICEICFPGCVKGFKNCIKILMDKNGPVKDIGEALNKSNEKSKTLRKKISRAGKGVAFVYAIMCLVLLIACLLIVLECIGFYVQIAMYTVMGIIINASKTLKFLMLAFMIVFYARDCLNGVIDIYLNFNQQIAKAVQALCGDEITKVTEKSADLQENTAFQVNPENIDPELDITCKFSRGLWKWEMKRVVLFIDKYDKPFITDKFFFDACNMKYVGCPGPVMPHLIRAVVQILTIILFLLFVVFVVVAFGDEYISGTNQTLVTLAGGLLPFIFRKILFSPTKGITLDVNNLNFKNGFHDLINNYVQSWPVSNKYIDMQDCCCEDSERTPEESKRRDSYGIVQPRPEEIAPSDDACFAAGVTAVAMVLATVGDGSSKDNVDTHNHNQRENGDQTEYAEKSSPKRDHNDERMRLLSDTGNEDDNTADV